MQIDPKSAVPIYLQIVDEVQEAIAAGVYRPGECLPSLRALAVDLGVNPNTVQRAYDAMEREGTLESRRGVGVFVTDKSQLSATGASERKTAKALTQAVQNALKEGISVDRLRALFEHALSTSRRNVQGTRK